MRSETQREYVDYVTARLPHLKRAAYLLCGDSDRADDIVQATVTALYVHWQRATTVDNLDGYVHRMLVRRYLDEKRHRWSRVVLTETLPDRGVAPADGVEDSDLVSSALRRLAPGQRAVLVLRFLCDLSVEDTAAALRCSQGNVKAQTARALDALRSLMGTRKTTDMKRS
ncbi:SigE family RNA polymerase sigma factor [Rugosimonospora africana]|uniref:RNA polymerase sigma24 factor n=1 Tax=Rugosimonospora africana TaxID=556532 RepID=A0A8J3R0Z9_9ACTN|nr:SigE family RNA polymerase sigma factor [Rugosimonospora africana]GIH19598.1 RNA polymerase sigma24 factor [Rugosimonospora africana]